MLGVHVAAEELEAVVSAVEHFHVFDLRAAAHAAQGQTVQLLGRSEHDARVTDGHILQRTRAVAVVAAAELMLLESAGGAFEDFILR